MISILTIIVILVVLFLLFRYVGFLKNRDIYPGNKKLVDRLTKHFDEIDEFNKNYGVIDKSNGIPTYYINLDRSPDRKEYMESHLKSLGKTPHRVSGFDGKQMRFPKGEHKGISYDFSKYPGTSNEYACLLSHLCAIKTAYDNNEEWALILEDDAYLGMMSFWDLSLNEIMDKYNPGFIHLSINDKEMREWNNDYSATAYVVTRKAMSKINELFQGNKLVLDESVREIYADHYIFSYLNKHMKVLMVPKYVVEHIKPSTLTNGSIHYNIIKEASEIIEKKFIKIKSFGNAEHDMGRFLRVLIQRAYNQPLIIVDRKPMLSIHSNPPGKIMKPSITWSGEPYRVSEYDDESSLNLLSQMPEKKGDVWVPFGIVDFNEEKLDKLLNKKFKKMREKKKFLAYISSRCIKEREDFFAAVREKRKDADGLGKCSNTVVRENDRQEYKDNGKLLEDYRFVIAMENTRMNGYITEKIINAYLSGAIPIYWGSQNIKEIFNPETFINVSDFNSFEECVDYIDSLDNDVERMERIKEMNIFKDGIVPDMFKWFEKDNKFMGELAERVKTIVV